MQEPYQYIIFRASEVKDLSVDEPAPLRSVHDDPAVLGVRIPLHHIHFHPRFCFVGHSVPGSYMGAPPLSPALPPFFFSYGLCILILIAALNTGICAHGSKRIFTIPTHGCSAGPSTTTSATTVPAATTATTAGAPSGAWTSAFRRQ